MSHQDRIIHEDSWELENNVSAAWETVSAMDVKKGRPRPAMEVKKEKSQWRWTQGLFMVSDPMGPGSLGFMDLHHLLRP